MRTPTIPAMGIERGSMPAETPQRKITDSRPSLRVVVKASRNTCHHPDGLPPFCRSTWQCISTHSNQDTGPLFTLRPALRMPKPPAPQHAPGFLQQHVAMYSWQYPWQRTSARQHSSFCGRFCMHLAVQPDHAVAPESSHAYCCLCVTNVENGIRCPQCSHV